jgi:peptidyl-prolyl cis-trans isomerase B (cyclophilin B)
MKKLILLTLVLTLSFVLTSCGNSDPDEEPIVHEIPREVPVNLQELTYAEYLNLNNPVVTLTVEGMGEVKFQLFPDVAPNTVNSFIQYVQDGEYDNNSFHRVITGFMIQGGKLEEPACNIPGEMSANDFENDLNHYSGVLSMAKIGNEYDSATSQFFILTSNANYLDDEYTTFGGLISGFQIVNYIAGLQSESGEFPSVTVTITSMTVELNGYTPADRVCVTE